ncbi:MAG: hypothetical protein FWG90_03570 [Oscillospiraceae bacterium]|nr:hypothetical protein [Oscillospiraceae bacterium]
MITEQITFDAIDADTYEILKKIVNEACLKLLVDRKYIAVEENKDESYSVWIKEPLTEENSYRVFGIIKRKKYKYKVEMTRQQFAQIPPPDNAEVRKSKFKYKDNEGKVYEDYRYNVIFPLDSNNAEEYLYARLCYSLDKFEPSEKIGCCGKYVECSDNTACLHDNNFYARCCYYRKNLEAGLIFYGKNKNIS